MSPNDADGMANSVDPDQTAPDLSVRKLRKITVPCIACVSISFGISQGDHWQPLMIIGNIHFNCLSLRCLLDMIIYIRRHHTVMVLTVTVERLGEFCLPESPTKICVIMATNPSGREWQPYWTGSYNDSVANFTDRYPRLPPMVKLN